MKLRFFCATFLLLATLSFLSPLASVRAAGGRIEGKVTDPKGATVAGATVIATDTVTNQTFTALTDKQGQYKIEGLPPGVHAAPTSLLQENQCAFVLWADENAADFTGPIKLVATAKRPPPGDGKGEGEAIRREVRPYTRVWNDGRRTAKS